MLKRYFIPLQDYLSQLSSKRSAKNVLWNLMGGIWAGILVVLATPWYVSRIGYEGYGIVGIWLMMQVMMGLLDAGMGATLMREFSDFSRNREYPEYKRNVLRTLEGVYWAIALLCAIIFLLAAGWVNHYWLNAHQLGDDYITSALRWMSIALCLQFPNALYSSGLAGLQKQGKMNILQILGNSLRYGGGAAILYFKADLNYFFAVQAFVGFIQTFLTRSVLWRIISETTIQPPLFRIEIIQKLWRFSAGMALTALSAVLLSNMDRIVLSKMMPTLELGKYSVAFTASGLLQLGIQPFYRAFFPRYSELVSAHDPKQLKNEYFQSCRLMAAIIVPLGIVGWVFAPCIFQTWLGKEDPIGTNIFRWLLIGITCSGLMWLPAAFQQAHRWTSLHAAMIAGALIIGSPCMVWAIKTYGTVGATTVWVLHGISDITLGLWLMHRRLLKEELSIWYKSVILPPLLAAIPLGVFSWWLMPKSINRWISLSWIGATGALLIAMALCFTIIRFHNRAQIASK
jgi:O-antigen/teichoic acid export membrane protein